MAENGPKMTRKKRSFFHDARDIVMMPCVRYWKNPIKTAGDIVVRTNFEFEAFFSLKMAENGPKMTRS